MGVQTITGTAGKYSITSDGTIISNKKEKALKLRKDKDGYLRTNIYNKDGKMITVKVHRLVATHFLENPFNLPVVNHIDFDITNNDIKNLEWCTEVENHTHSAKAGRTLCPSRRQVSIQGQVFSSLNQAAKAVGLSTGKLYYLLNSENTSYNYIT